jgi:phytoene synthase
VSVGDAYRTCQRIAREVARTFYYGSLFLPPAKRRAAWALYAFCRTADDMADEPELFPDPLGALAAWRAALRETYAGRPRGPVMTAWADVLRGYDVPLAPALELLDGVEMDVRGARYPTFDDLLTYCYRVAGTVGLLMAPVLGYDRPEALACAVDLGVAMQLTNIVRDIGEDARNGRVYLPEEELARAGYSRDELALAVCDGRLARVIEWQIARAESYYARGIAGIRMLAPDARLAMSLCADLYRAILRRVRGSGYDVFGRRARVALPRKLAAVPGAWLRLRLHPG